MRKLLYLFLVCMLLMGCRGNRYYLDKVEALWGVDYDSMQYYLLSVDSASLTSDESIDYQYFRMMASNNYLMSLGKQQVDSFVSIMKRRYPIGHERAFRCRQIELHYYYNKLNEWQKVDSLAHDLKHYLLTRSDSSKWYNYKLHTKKMMGEIDSAFHYIEAAMQLHLWEPRYAYEQQAILHQMNGQADSAIVCYLQSMEQDTTQNLFYLNHLVLNILVDVKDVRKATEYLMKVRQRMNRSDVPYYHLVKGDYWSAMHEPDSAMKSYRIATETGNDYIASLAYERMGGITKTRHSDGETFRMYHNAQRVWNDIFFSLNNEKKTHDFEALKIRNQLNELKVERQNHVILILGLTLFVLVLISGFVFYYIHQRRVNERKRLIQENVVLKQQEELSLLREREALMREKDARMREELFKRMHVFEKLSTLEKEQPIRLSESDWAEIRLMLDSGYADFTRKLKKAFPDLTDKEINFCCLVRIHVSLQSLSDIYCISKNSVSRRKLRLKEKMGIGEDTTLDDFLNLI